MKYYDRNCQTTEFDIQQMEKVGKGECAQVYRYQSDKILKVYFSTTVLEARLQPRVFDILKDIENEHLMKIYQLYSDMNYLSQILYKMKCLSFTTDAYTAEYYQEQKINALEEPTEYLLDNVKELEDLFDIFTKKQAITWDVKRANTVMDSNNIIIIDPDLFYISKLSNVYTARTNKMNLLRLVRSILYWASTEQQDYQKLEREITIELDETNISGKTNVTDYLYKKLKYSKKPIDYFRKNKEL